MNMLAMTKRLYYFLGKESNLINITNCSSRLRIEVQRPIKVADDSKFLDLDIRGIVRSGKNIHIILNNQSHAFATLLQNIVTTISNPITPKIIEICQGHIHSMSQENNVITINLSKNITINTKIVSELEAQKVNVIKKNNQIEITHSHKNLLEEIENTWFLWDLFVSNTLATQIDFSTIKKISYQNNHYCLQFQKSIPHFETNQWEHIGISEIHVNEKDKEIQFFYPKEELLNNLQAIFEISKNAKKFKIF